MTTLSLNDQRKFRLNEISKIKDYFDKTLIALYPTSGRIREELFLLQIFWNSCRSNMCKPYFSVFFNYRNIEETIKRNKKKKKKHSKIIMLAKSKLNSIESLMSQALIDLDISHDEFKAIVNEKKKYDPVKESIRNKKDGDEFSENR